MARHKPIKITSKPSPAEIDKYWMECFASPHRKNGAFNAIQQRVYQFYWDNREKGLGQSGYDGMYEALLKGKYLEIVQPPTSADAGAEEYDLIMKGQRKWASIRTNSGN